MTDDEVKVCLETAIRHLVSEKPPLDFSRVHERTTAHRLAAHMEVAFEKWNVDCEYDRDGQLKKALAGIKDCEKHRATEFVLPDIIVHRRGELGRENNLLVIELKKDTVHDECDWMKLSLLTAPRGHYAYQLGLYINIRDGKFERTWFKDGAPR